MPDLSPGQFRMMTNMKAAPNSQGTLFQGNNPTHYPRGFTPERRDEVRDAMGVSSYLLAGNRGKPSGHNGPGTRPDIAAGVSTVARSTVPAEHLPGAHYAFGQQLIGDNPPRGYYQRAVPNHENPYSRRSHVVIGAGSAQSTTPIHEIGHHVSATSGNDHADYDTPSRRGTEEGFAENYAETHYRDHRGRPLGTAFTTSPEGWSRREEPEGQFGGTYGDRGDFERAFTKERKKSPTGVREQAKIDTLMSSTPKGQIKGQTPLLHRMTSGYPAQEHLAKWDYNDDGRAQGLHNDAPDPWRR